MGGAYLLLDGGQDVVGRGAVSLHGAAGQTVTDGQQVALFRGCALLRGWHSSCVDAHTATAVISTSARLAPARKQQSKQETPFPQVSKRPAFTWAFHVRTSELCHMQTEKACFVLVILLYYTHFQDYFSFTFAALPTAKKCHCRLD